MKRLLSVLLVTLLVVASVPASLLCAFAAERSFVSVNAPASVMYTGDGKNDTFTVSCELTLASELAGAAGYEIVLHWDASVLAVTDSVSVKGTGMSMVNLDGASNGSAKIVVANATDVITSGTLFEIDFYPLADCIDATVEVEVQRLSTANGFVACDGGKATVSLIPLPPVCVNTNDFSILTDGKSLVSGDWGDAGTHNVVLIANPNCTKTDMDVEILYPLGETVFVDSVSLYFYHCAEAMIGYPENTVTVWSSVDGEHFERIGEYDLRAVDLIVGKYGTVENTFAFDPTKAAYIKFCFSVGSSIPVLGNTPAAGKIFWEFAALTEISHKRYCEHIYAEAVVTEATCTAAGVKVYTCTECGDTYTEPIAALGHTPGNWETVKEATDKTHGERILKCTVCKEIIEREMILAPNHGYDNGVITLEPTCDTDGIKLFSCNACENSYTEIIPALGHKEGEWTLGKDATCTEDGENVKKCTVCGEIMNRQTIPASGHTAGEWVISKEATADEDGQKSQSCTVCGEILLTAGIPKHVSIDTPASDAPLDIDDLWGNGDATAQNITLITNPDPTLTDMDVTLVQTLSESALIDGITLYLYHCASSMIGYPEGKATVMVSSDGVNYTPVGEFALANAELSVGKAGTVANEFTFETAVEAVSVKIILHVGKSTDVLGENPAEGKVYWEYIGVVSLGVSEVPAQPDWVKGDVDGDGKFDAKDYLKLKRYILGTFELDSDALLRSDIDLDGKVAARDYLMLKRICLGTLDFPA